MDADLIPLPAPFADWFAKRGWRLREHQAAMLAAARAGDDVLLIAPTGAGKTLAGFLPSLVELADQRRLGDAPPVPALHTLYISPLKALAVDIARNLLIPVEEMGLRMRIETRTGDTPPAKRSRQRIAPPDLLLTTPEQIAVMLAQPGMARFFADLRAIIVDEAHALAPTKRGDLLALGLQALVRMAPRARRIGLSATVADERALAAWLSPTAKILRGAPGPPPNVAILDSAAPMPWGAHTGRHAIPELYAAIKTARTTLVFVNTRSQAEIAFQELWAINADNLPIALHHGSLDVAHRRRVESLMAAGQLRAVVCTSTLDLGIDWGDVDLVVQLGAPKGSARLLQRIGRSNHTLERPSRALLAPTNRFETLECRASLEAAEAGAIDGPGPRRGGLDVLAQHVLSLACAGDLTEDGLVAEVMATAPYAALTRADIERVLDFAATGGYALRAYERLRKVVRGRDGRLRIRDSNTAQRHRMNIGTIIEAPMLRVRLAHPGGRGGKTLGEIEEDFIAGLGPRDTFLFAGEVLRYVGLQGVDVLVERAAGAEPKVPAYAGGRFPMTTYLADRVRRMIADQGSWAFLPEQVREWLELQRARSAIPDPGRLLIETFPRGLRHFLVAYPFEGRLAHQTLGMLLTRRLERWGLKPLGFVANDYALGIWGIESMADVDLAALFHEDMLGDDLEEWLQESALMKRAFAQCAVISGLIERRQPGAEKNGRQVTFSTDLVYDVLRKHAPDHLLLQAARADAGEGLLDIQRLGAGLKRINGAILHQALRRVSPFAVPVLSEVGKSPVYGSGQDAVIDAAAAALAAEAMG